MTNKLFQSLFDHHLVKTVGIALGVLMHGPALAWDGAHTGRVHIVELTDAENFGFRVYFDPGGPMCGAGSAHWGYINKSWSNYEAMVSVLLTARADKSNVTALFIRSGEYCRIGYVTVHPRP
jgi:hypothetical protein